LVEHDSLKCFCNEWKKGYQSVVLKLLGLEWVSYPSLLKCCGKGIIVKRCVDDVSTTEEKLFNVDDWG